MLVGWIIDIVLNGIVWLIITAFLISLIDVTDKWTRKAIMYMDVVDKWVRKLLENSLEWIQKKNRLQKQTTPYESSHKSLPW